MRLAALPLAALLAGAPAAASAPTFWIGVQCNGPMPVGMQIVASGPGETIVLLDELLAFCAAQSPAEKRPQTWRGTT